MFTSPELMKDLARMKMTTVKSGRPEQFETCGEAWPGENSGRNTLFATARTTLEPRGALPGRGRSLAVERPLNVHKAKVVENAVDSQ